MDSTPRRGTRRPRSWRVSALPIAASVGIHVAGAFLLWYSAFGIAAGELLRNLEGEPAAPEPLIFSVYHEGAADDGDVFEIAAQPLSPDSVPIPTEVTPDPPDFADLSVELDVDPDALQLDLPLSESADPATGPGGVGALDAPPVSAHFGRKISGHRAAKPGAVASGTKGGSAASGPGGIASGAPGGIGFRNASGSGTATTAAAIHFGRNKPPEYPVVARREGWEGVCVVRARISADGRCVSADVVETSGFPALDESALAAVRDWSFKPALDAGLQPIESDLDIPIRFRLAETKPAMASAPPPQSPPRAR